MTETTSSMTAERFEDLAFAYGGDLRRWPDAVQADARTWVAAQGPEAEAVLAEAAELDGLLDAAEAPAPNLALRNTIIASVPARRSYMPRTAVWVSATGLLAACAAGVVFGADLSTKVWTDPAGESVAQTSTAFDSVSYLDTSSVSGSAG